MEIWNKQAAWVAINELGLKGDNLRLAHYWLSLWSHDRPPKRSSFNPNQMRDLLVGIAIFDVRPDEGVHCRLAGAAYKFRFGFDISRKDWLELTPPDQRPLRLKRNTTIVRGEVSAGLRSDPDRHGPTQWFSDVQLPFSGLGEDGARSYLHHSEWRPSGEEFLIERSRKQCPMPADKFASIPIC